VVNYFKMRSIVILSIILLSFVGKSQEYLDNLFIFNDGIYSTFHELKINKPKYPGYNMNKNEKIYLSLAYIYDPQDNKYEYKDSLFAMVNNQILYVYYKHNFYKPLYKGTITVFTSEERSNHWEAMSVSENILFFLDFNTGKIESLNLKTFEPVIKRDEELYKEFKKNSKSKNRELLNYFVLKFNKRNPTIIKENVK
jgi:hypothetical protein